MKYHTHGTYSSRAHLVIFLSNKLLESVLQYVWLQFNLVTIAEGEKWMSDGKKRLEIPTSLDFEVVLHKLDYAAFVRESFPLFGNRIQHAFNTCYTRTCV